MARHSSSSPVEPTDVLYRIKRGLCAYVSYLAACEMNEAFSEYVLYEPILRILTARGYTVQCEYICPGIKQPKTGDKKRLDFMAEGHSVRLALEVKWANATRPDIARDMEKLKALHKKMPSVLPLLCVFGRKSHIKGLELSEDDLVQRGRMIVADLYKTRFACRIFQLGYHPKSRR